MLTRKETRSATARIRDSLVRWIACLAIVGASAPQARAQVIKDLQFEVAGVLPSVDPEIRWFDDGIHPVFPESTFMSVAGGVLRQRSFGVFDTYPVYGYPDCPPNQGTPSLLDPARSTILEVRVKALALEGIYGARAEFYSGERYYTLSLDALGVWTRNENWAIVHFPVNVFEYHVYRLEADGGCEAFRLYVDGVLAISARAPVLPGHDGFVFGDDSGFPGQSGDADWDYVTVTQTAPVVAAYCTAGTTTNGCRPTMSATGTPSVSASSGFVLDCNGVEGNKLGLIFYGLSGPKAAPWRPGSTSYQCVKGPVQRTPATHSGGTAGACDGRFSVDLLAYFSTHPNALGQPIPAGRCVYVQAWFRDPPAPGTTNLSNALRFGTQP